MNKNAFKYYLVESTYKGHRTWLQWPLMESRSQLLPLPCNWTQNGVNIRSGIESKSPRAPSEWLKLLLLENEYL